jgi:hypothetical protein
MRNLINVVLFMSLSVQTTLKNIQAGAEYAERDGTVPSWFGICHGRAPASFMEKRPFKSVKAKGADRRENRIHPF